MIARESGLRMEVGRFSRLPRGVGVRALPDGGLDTRRPAESVCEVPLGAGVLRLLVPGVAVGEIFDHHCVEDGVISATLELFKEDEGVQF